MTATPPPVDLVYYDVPPVDPWGALAGFLGVGVLLYVGLLALVIWGFYWLIRLAARHALMDVERWKRRGMPERKRSRTPPPYMFER